MTIIFKYPKYDYLQYDNNFKKIVIFKIQNMTQKKTYAPPPGKTPSVLGQYFDFLVTNAIKTPSNGSDFGEKLATK